MADANSTRLSVLQETVFNTIPANPAWQRLRMTGEGLKSTTGTKTSDELREDRQVSGFYRTSLSTDGPINFELSYGNLDTILPGIMFSAGWSTGIQTTSGVGVNGSTITGVSGASGTIGQWIQTSGFTTAKNNGIFKITNVSGGTVTIAGGPFVTETGGKAQIGAQLVNGVTQNSFAFERVNTDLPAGGYTWFTGNILNTLSLSVEAGSLITGSIGPMGLQETGGDVALAGSTYTAAPTNRSMSAVDDVFAIFEGGAKTPARSFSISLTNNARPRPIIGQLFPESIGKGEFGVSGNLTVYFKDASLVNKYRNFTESAIGIGFYDHAGNGYAIDLPCLKYGDGPANSSGKNTDVMANMSYNAYMHATELITMRVTRFPAMV